MSKRFCATWPITMFVLSPSVATTTASASSIPASRSTSASMPWPTMNEPGQPSPRRVSASSFSSTTVTSQPSRWSSRATDEPTRPQPMTSAFMAGLTVARLCLLEHALREGHDQHLGVRLAQDVVDRRREEAGLAPPAGRGAEHDQVGARLVRGLDDRLADRARADGAALDRDAVVGTEHGRLGERRGRALLLVEQLRVEGLVE